VSAPPELSILRVRVQKMFSSQEPCGVKISWHDDVMHHIAPTS
jgi:hypothetical protein